ncbi:serine hydrolase [Sphingosinicella sp. CPCC 101087]|uniref:serine hydrolase domain-containing protein n=1 Tax=Sphingosinicella sp. CPCC 101087 TaxID=2497754 RepID=UPI00101BAEC6|nr:serine hydrolase domain-containing protein [Sphingosinicella sp. CPCC 101087]
MTYPLNRRSFLAHAAGTAAGLVGSGAVQARLVPGLAELIDAERAAVREGMAEGGIGAAAICLVHQGRTLWMEGFGRTPGGPVGPDTIFSIQSTSKNFTAVAVLLAVQEGLLDLDAPITRYLPDFSVNSRFEPAPQDRITLRLLLSNRAGFTHEAPVGNNYEPAAPSFEAHIRSISQTWLRFPVGERYRYSNLGYDLAGHILERKAGLAYAEWLRRKLFQPLGMRDSTADPAVYSKVANRAVGTQGGHAQVPLVTPLVASGGVYTSARDMAAYAAFHLGGGEWQGRQILAPELWAEMHGFGLGGDYGLGVMRSELRYGSTPVRVLHHRGGGFGFGCNFVYCPEAELGWAALFNRPASAGYRFGTRLIERLLAARFGERIARLPAAALAPIRPLAAQAQALVGTYVGRNVRAQISESGGQLRFSQDEAGTPNPLGVTAPDALFTVKEDGETVTYRYHPSTAALPAHLECSEGEASLDYNDGPNDPPGPDRPEWDRHVGRYRVDQWGKPAMEITIERRRGYLYLNAIRLIVEPEPGLFFTSDGEAVDFRSPVPTWRNLLLRRV